MANAAIAKPKKQRNYAVDFWRFLATLAVCWGHFNGVGFRFTEGGVNYPNSGYPFMGGSVLGIFLIFTGYFLMKSFESKKRRGLLADKTPRQNAVEYLKTRYIGLWPALVMGLLFGVVVGGIGAYTGMWHGKLFTMGESFNGLQDIIAGFNTTFLQWFGLDATGIQGDTGWAFQWNSPLWYISAIFVGGYFMYYLLCKNEDLTSGLIVPLIVIVCPAVWAMSSEIGMNNRGVLFAGLIENALAFGTWGIALGMLLYHPYERFRKMGFTEKGRKWLTVLSVLCTGWLVYLCVFDVDNLYVAVAKDGGRINSEMYIDLFACIALSFAIANQDWLTRKVLNHKVFGTLGEFSLYFFIVHIHVINVVCGLVGGENVTTVAQYYQWLLVVILVSAVLGVVMMFICKKGIQPLLYKLDVGIQAATKRGEEERAAQKAA